jgi:hypothetical protein
MVESDAEVLVKEERWWRRFQQRLPLQSSSTGGIQPLFFVALISASTHY